MGFSGYQGWGNAEALADFKSTGGQGKGSSSSGVSSFSNRPAAPNFQNIYDTALTAATAGIQPQIDAINTQIAAKTDAYNTQVSKIKDNPYLSEATMSGRLSKLAERFNADMQLETKKQAIVEGKLAQGKADAQVKLNIAAQQYNVEDSQYQQNLQLFTNLLSSGALENASGTDIAQITSSTGLSSSMVQSIINFQKKKNAPQPNITTVDDGTNQYVVAIDPSTGNVINKQIIARSIPKSTGGGGGTAGERTAAAAKTALSDMSSLINGALDASGKKASSLQKGSDGYLSPQAYQYYRSLWVAQGLSTKDFEAQFSYLKNPYQEGY